MADFQSRRQLVSVDGLVSSVGLGQVPGQKRGGSRHRLLQELINPSSVVGTVTGSATFSET